jgi:UDP-GlcNAc:undecaprenyl-phosphate GlcNAc-1-phosphate transferase
MILVGLAALLIPLVLAWVFTRAAIPIAKRFDFVDRPSARKTHARPTPLGGGIAIFLAIFTTFGLAFAAAAAVQASPGLAAAAPEIVREHAPGVLACAPLLGLILAAGAVQALVGWIDDARGLSVRVRLAVEVGLVAVLLSQGVQLDVLPGWTWLTWPLTILWIVGLTNAFNFLDNMDGLSAGVAAIASAFFAAVAFLMGELFVGGCFLAFAGATLGFLRWNWPPARIFLGDAGSNFLGFWIAVLTVVATFKTEEYSHVTLLAPLCIAAVPIYDAASVVLLRLSQGRSPFQPDRRHFSHRLVDLGFDSRSAVLLIHLLTTATGLAGLALYFVRPVGAIFIVLQVACMLGVVAILEFVAMRRSGGGNP